MKRNPLLLLLIFIVIAFVFTRLYSIKEGLFFFNDYGRDMFVLHQWKESFKPPLLGPQNSALPFNQPAIYFYWLMPVYILSGFSAFSNVYTLILTAIVCLGVGLFLLRKQISWWPIVLAYSWLVVIHPQHIIQNRFIWNPSFIPAFLGFSLLSLAYLQRHWSGKALVIFAVSMALAVSFSYAVAPVLIVVGLLIAWWWRQEWKKIVQIWCALAGAILFFQIPTLVFEVKYNFQLTRAVLFGERPVQAGIDFASKLKNLGEFIIGGETLWQVFLFLTCTILVISNFWQIQVHKKQKEPEDSVFLLTLPVLIVTIVLTLILPIAVHSHYIFGITTLLFLQLASLRPKLRFLGLMLVTLFWLQPIFTQHMFTPARRSVQDLERCAQLVCSQETQPLFIATESKHHTFHNGPEFRYAFAHAGCNVQVLEQNPSAAQQLAIIEDDGDYQHRLSNFYELSLFGSSSVARSYQCPGKMEVFILEKAQ